MLCNRSVASAKPHIANLVFAEVFENAVSPVAVRIPMFKSLFACDDNYDRVLRRRYDSSLLLATKARVNVDPPIVNAANFKSPGHLPASNYARLYVCAALYSRRQLFANAAIATSWRSGQAGNIERASTWNPSNSTFISAPSRL
jgi:hypothetical protein